MKKLTVAYCEFSGSSRGARDFVEKALPAFREKFPQYEVATEVLRPASDACRWAVPPGEAVEDVLDAVPATSPLKVEDVLDLQSMTV